MKPLDVSSTSSDGLNRRAFAGGSLLALATSCLLPQTAAAHGAMGPVSPPLLAPALSLTDHHGQTRAMRDALAASVTVVQTMFTGCSTVCPIQGAVFAEVQRRLAAQRTGQPVRLLSISVDALGDSPPTLRAWLQRLQADDRWWAGVPRVADVLPLQMALDGPGAIPRVGVDAHNNQLYVFDAQAKLRWRSSSLPSVDEVMRAVTHYAT
jgi:protein SCO1